jgi:hypothetical protein
MKMKQLVFTVAMFFAFGIPMNAQTTSAIQSMGEIKNFQATVENNNLLVNWTAMNGENSNYWEVQGSKDGKSFTTIGLVMGADEKMEGSTFRFKQQLNKMKPGLIYYRVLHIEKNNTAISSGIIQSAK